MGVMAWESLTGGTMDVPYEILATFSVSAFFELERGYHLHASGIAAQYLKETEIKVASTLSNGKISQQQAVQLVKDAEKALQDHASTINKGLGAVAYLDQKGFFNSQKALGFPLVALVLGLSAIAAAALVIVSVYQISVVNGIIQKECSKFQDEKMRLACIQEMSRKLPSIDFSAITGQVAKWVMIGLLAVGGVYFAPTVVRSLLGARKELKAAK